MSERTTKESAVVVKNLTDKLRNIYIDQLSKVNVTVWMNINGEEEQVIALYNVYQDPFELGEVIHLKIEDFEPNELSQYKPENQAQFNEDNIRRRELFGNKWIFLTRKQKYVKSKYFQKDTIEIEYFADFTEKPLRH